MTSPPSRRCPSSGSPARSTQTPSNNSTSSCSGPTTTPTPCSWPRICTWPTATPPKDYVQFADGFVKELTSAYNSAAPGKVYCLNLGDFSWDGYWYDNKWALPECKQSVEDFNFQMWSVMGNHDNDPYVASDFGAEGPYRQHMGPVYYAMNIGRIHYIMLDNTEYLNTGGSQGTVGSRNYNRASTTGSWHGSRRNSPMSTNRPRSSWDATVRFTRTAEAAA